MTADQLDAGSTTQLGLGRLLPLGGPRGRRVAHGAGGRVGAAPRRAPTCRAYALGTLRLALADPDATHEPAVPASAERAAAGAAADRRRTSRPPARRRPLPGDRGPPARRARRGRDGAARADGHGGGSTGDGAAGGGRAGRRCGPTTARRPPGTPSPRRTGRRRVPSGRRRALAVPGVGPPDGHTRRPGARCTSRPPARPPCRAATSAWSSRRSRRTTEPWTWPGRSATAVSEALAGPPVGGGADHAVRIELTRRTRPGARELRDKPRRTARLVADARQVAQPARLRRALGGALLLVRAGRGTPQQRLRLDDRVPRRGQQRGGQVPYRVVELRRRARRGWRGRCARPPRRGRSGPSRRSPARGRSRRGPPAGACRSGRGRARGWSRAWRTARRRRTTRRSQASASWKPAPMAWPCTAAMLTRCRCAATR